MKKHQKLLIAIGTGLFAIGMVGSANAALVGRLPATPGGTDYQAYFDTNANLTWLADVKYAQTSGYLSKHNIGTIVGGMTWNGAKNWVSSLNVDSVTGWRLPTMIDTGTPGCNFSISGTDCGYNVQTGSAATVVYSELASLWYDTLGNKGFFNSSGQRSSGFYTNKNNWSPFINFDVRSTLNLFWTGVENSTATYQAWYFNGYLGMQAANNFKTNQLLAWAVHSGDVSAVPLPASAWLFGSGLLGLIGLVKRKSKNI